MTARPLVADDALAVPFGDPSPSHDDSGHIPSPSRSGRELRWGVPRSYVARHRPAGRFCRVGMSPGVVLAAQQHRPEHPEHHRRVIGTLGARAALSPAPRPSSTQITTTGASIPAAISVAVPPAMAAQPHPRHHRHGHEDHHARLVDRRRPVAEVAAPCPPIDEVEDAHPRHHRQRHLAEVEREPPDAPDARPGRRRSQIATPRPSSPSASGRISRSSRQAGPSSARSRVGYSRMLAASIATLVLSWRAMSRKVAS